MRFSIFGFHLMMIVSLFLLLLQMMGVVQSTGTLELKMNNFRNPTEHLTDGSCCDALCIGQCDDIFHFSLDQSTGSTNDPKSYSYWTKPTTTYQDQNNVDFNDNMNGVNNPIIWSFNAWPGTVLFKVYIEDDDQPYSSNDYIDGMVQTLTLTPAQSKASASPTTITIYGQRDRDKTSLSMTYTLYCDANFYGPTCTVFCVEQDTDADGHYTCHPGTGAKVCRPGWEDVSLDCKTFSDDCVGSNCLNGAKCVDGVRSYTCACVAGFTGNACETNINECASSPCVNGATCSDLVNAFTCACTSGHVGPRCAQSACQTSPCVNGGVCHDDQQCFCPTGYTGSRCELRQCEAVPCVNGGTCMANGTCACPLAFTGSQCGVEQCSLVSDHCQNGASCVNGACSCPSPFWGVNCERESCTNDTCWNGGTCNDTNDATGYRCKCASSFTGFRCQSTVAKQPPCNQPIKSDSVDVTIFHDDAGTLLIILIIICIVLLIVVVALIVFIICKRRRERIAEKSRITSVTSTTTLSAIDIGSTSSSSTSTPPSTNIYTNSPDDVFLAVGESSGKPRKGKGLKGYEEYHKGNDDIDSHYERLEANVEHGYVDQSPAEEAPELPERFSCDIKDIHGDKICMATKLADC